MPNNPKEKLKLFFKTNYNKFFPVKGTKDIVYLCISNDCNHGMHHLAKYNFQL